MLRLAIGLLLAALAATGVSAQGSYQIRPGDSLQVEVLEDPGLNRNVLVLPDGSISFPMVGSLPAAGQSVDQLRSAIASGLAPNFATSPNVYVSVGTLAEIAPRVSGGAVGVGIYVMGEIASPGKVDVAPGTTLLQALAQAGGFTPFAATKRIELHRTDRKSGAEQVYIFNYDRSGGGNSIRGSTPLARGDVIVVPQRRLFE